MTKCGSALYNVDPHLAVVHVLPRALGRRCWGGKRPAKTYPYPPQQAAPGWVGGKSMVCIRGQFV